MPLTYATVQRAPEEARVLAPDDHRRIWLHEDQRLCHSQQRVERRPPSCSPPRLRARTAITALAVRLRASALARARARARAGTPGRGRSRRPRIARRPCSRPCTPREACMMHRAPRGPPLRAIGASPGSRPPARRDPRPRARSARRSCTGRRGRRRGRREVARLAPEDAAARELPGATRVGSADRNGTSAQSMRMRKRPSVLRRKRAERARRGRESARRRAACAR